MIFSSTHLQKQHFIVRNNKWFTFTLTCGLGILGSVISMMTAVAAVGVLFFQLNGRIDNSFHPGLWKVARYFLSYFLVTIIFVLFHASNINDLAIIVNRLPFLEFYPIAIAISYSDKIDIKKYLETGAAFGSILTLVVVIIGIMIGIGRAEGGSGNPGPFGISMCLAYVLCLLGFVRNTENIYKILMFAGIITSFVCVLSSGMRALWPALILLPLIALWGCKFFLNKTLMISLICTCIILSTLIFLFFGDMLIWRLMQVLKDADEIINNGQYDNSLGVRLVIADYAWQSLPGAFWIGVGSSNALAGLTEFSEQKYGILMHYSHFHNIFIDAILRGGIIELIATIALFVGPIVTVWHCRSCQAMRYGVALIIAVILIYFTAGLFNLAFGHDIQDSLYTYMMATATAIIFGQSKSTQIEMTKL